MEYYLQKKKIIKNREMRNFTFKGLFLAVVFIVLGSLSIQAADDGLITRQVTIKLEKAGTLPNKIGSTKKFQITNLKIIGEINGTDLRMIREMAGKDARGDDTDGMLSVLDLSDAKIVEGGDYDGYYIILPISFNTSMSKAMPYMLENRARHTYTLIQYGIRLYREIQFDFAFVRIMQ